MKVRRFLTAALALFLFLAFAAQLCWAGGTIVASPLSEDNAPMMAGPEDYWTPDRMKRAKPLDRGIKGSPPALNEQGLMALEPAFGEEPGLSAGKPPEGIYLPRAETLKPPLLIDLPGSLLAAAAAYTYPPPHTTYPVFKEVNKVFPFGAVGTLYFVSDKGVNYFSSGSINDKYMVLSAGHCVAENGKWFKNWKFVVNGSGDAYYGYQAFTDVEWFKKNNLAYDAAFIVMKKKNGYGIGQKNGFLGFAWNQSVIQHYNMIGFPKAPPWDGTKKVITHASFSRLDTTRTPNTIGVGTTQTKGASGGPWILKLQQASGACNYAGSLFSYYYGSKPHELYGPYFNTRTNNLRLAAKAVTPP